MNAASRSYAVSIVTRPLPRAADAVRATRAAHDSLLAGDDATERVRGVIAESWRRSVQAGLDPERSVAPTVLDRDRLAEYRATHPLAAVLPMLTEALGGAIEACECVLAIADVHGSLLWVHGRSEVLRRAEAINFVEGTSWDEQRAGTNAPGTALRLDTAVQIHGAEHFTHAVQQWSCAAAPVHDPDTHAVLGVVDVTGGGQLGAPQTLAMVRAAARMAEAELGRRRALGLRDGVSGAAAGTGRITLQGLGRSECLLGDGHRVLRLSRRHSELVTILAGYPDGLSSEQLAVEVYDDHAALSTIRAEMTRLRALLGEAVVASRPYRLRLPVAADWRTVERQLAAGRLADALGTYHGPLLPRSDAPGIAARRDRLERKLRHAVLQSGSVELMIAWTQAAWGTDDLEMWRQQHRLLPAGSPLRPIASAEIARLDLEYGIPGRR